MSAHTPYGFCKGCQKWVPRDEMLSINVVAYSADNEQGKVRLRLCPPCHKARLEDIRKFEWDHVLKQEAEIRTDPDLVAASDLEFDDSEEAMRIAGRLI